MYRALWLAVPALVVACVDRLPDQDLRILGATPDTKLSVGQLWKEYQTGAEQARRAYFGKIVEITGSATRVGDDVPTDRYLFFGQDGEFGVRANLLDEQAPAILAQTREDPRVTLKCYCEGLDGNLILKSCVRP
jgi:tRNA_anti-like